MPEACYLPSYDGWIFGKIWGFTTETFSHVLAQIVEILSLHAGLNHATVWSDRNDQILFDCFSRDSCLLGSQVSSTLMATEWSSIALSVALLKNKHQRTYCTKSLNSWITTLHCSFVENVSFFFHTLQPQTFPKCGAPRSVFWPFCEARWVYWICPVPHGDELLDEHWRGSKCRRS